MPSSQGAAVAFNGVPIGYLTQVTVSGGTANLTEVTNVTSPVYGFGRYSRVCRQYDCVSIDPGSVSVTLLGASPYAPGDIGGKGPLVFSASAGGAFFPEAVLETYDVSASVGELLTATATFRVTGGPTFVGVS